MNNKNKIIIGSDHAGFELKNKVVKFLEKKNFNIEDKGVFDKKSVDYPDFAKKVTKEVLSDKNNLGILICGTGIGMSIAANKIKGINAALIYNKKTAELAIKHNNANVLTLGGRQISFFKTRKMLNASLSSIFEKERHLKRVNKIKGLESDEQ